MITRAIKVKPMSNYLLLIQFDTGEIKIFNCLLLMTNKIYSNIEDINYFKTVHIDDMGLVCWDEATDINPFFLYEHSDNVQNFTFTSKGTNY